jgi:hypothetical protein
MKHTIQEWMNGKLQPVEYETLLEALADQRAMTIEAKDGGFEVGDACDNYFSVRLTPDQLRALGEELIALAHASNEKGQLSGWTKTKKATK